MDSLLRSQRHQEKLVRKATIHPINRVMLILWFVYNCSLKESYEHFFHFLSFHQYLFLNPA